MNIQRILAVTSKEWREIVRDKIYLLLAFAMPMVLMLVFGYGMTQDVENIPMAIMDYDHTALSRDYSHNYSDSRYFDFKGYLNHLSEADQLLAEGKVKMVLVIPEHFQRDLMRGISSTTQTILDGSFTMPVRTIQGYVEAINGAATLRIQTQSIASESGLSPTRIQAILQPIKIEVRYLYNQELKGIWSLGPSLIMFALMLVSPLLMALSVVREKETGSIYNIYASTITRAEFLAGKLLPNVAIAFINGIILWFIVTFYFAAPFKGPFGFYLISTLAFVLCACSTGLLISLLVKTQQAALLIVAIIAMISSMQYSGLLVPTTIMKGTDTVIAHLLPPMYYNTILQGLFLKGVGFPVLWKELFALIVYSAILLTISYRLFHKRTAT